MQFLSLFAVAATVSEYNLENHIWKKRIDRKDGVELEYIPRIWPETSRDSPKRTAIPYMFAPNFPAGAPFKKNVEEVIAYITKTTCLKFKEVNWGEFTAKSTAEQKAYLDTNFGKDSNIIAYYYYEYNAEDFVNNPDTNGGGALVTPDPDARRLKAQLRNNDFSPDSKGHIPCTEIIAMQDREEFFPQRYYVGAQCMFHTFIAHYLGHMFGFENEHQRHDAAEYVDFLSQPRSTGPASDAFEQDRESQRAKDDCLNCKLGPYDYYSVMHWDNQFTAPKKTKENGEAYTNISHMRAGKNSYTSKMDLKKIREYSCRNNQDNGDDAVYPITTNTSTKDDPLPPVPPPQPFKDGTGIKITPDPSVTDEETEKPKITVDSNGNASGLGGNGSQDGIDAPTTVATSGRGDDMKVPTKDTDYCKIDNQVGVQEFGFRSPEYPNRLPNNYDCWYRFDNTDINLKVEIEFEKFNLENMTDQTCNDWIKLDNGAFFCARFPPNNGVLYSECGKPYQFRLKSDHGIKSVGFLGKARLVPCTQTEKVESSILQKVEFKDSAMSIWSFVPLLLLV